jgi:hypothetical protein
MENPGYSKRGNEVNRGEFDENRIEGGNEEAEDPNDINDTDYGNKSIFNGLHRG